MSSNRQGEAAAAIGATLQRKGALRAPHSAEPASQFTLKLSVAQHKELQRLAFEADMTMRSYVMHALKVQGLGVTDADLVDRRRR